jgi:hypothetical protein
MTTLEAPDTGADTEPDEAVTAAAPAPAIEAEPESGPGQTPPDLSRFHIPIGVVEGAPTSDGRSIRPQAMIWRDPPLPLMATDRAPHGNMPVTDAQHIGTITSISRRDVSGEPDRLNGGTYPDGSFAVHATGEFDMDNPDAAEFARRVYAGRLNTVSADMIARAMEVAAGEDDQPEEMMTKVELLGFTIVPHSAFAGCFIVGDDGAGNPLPHPADLLADPEAIAAAGPPWILHDSSAGAGPRRCVPCETGALTASAAPIEPPLEWFMNPELERLTATTITDEGQVFGHLADWKTCHTGINGQCFRPPRSNTGYAVFRTGAVKCADGTLVAVGQLTVGVGHASTRESVSVSDAMAHYDNIATAVADVSVGEDEHGIWFAGALRPDVTPEQIRAFRASRLSGDWRRWGSSLELIAALAVNVPGYVVQRPESEREVTLHATVASGQVVALIAAGPPPADVALAQIQALMPTLTAAAERELRAQAVEAQARADRALAARTRARQVRAADLRSRLAALTSKELS